MAFYQEYLGAIRLITPVPGGKAGEKRRRVFTTWLTDWGEGNNTAVDQRTGEYVARFTSIPPAGMSVIDAPSLIAGTTPSGQLQVNPPGLSFRMFVVEKELATGKLGKKLVVIRGDDFYLVDSARRVDCREALGGA